MKAVSFSRGIDAICSGEQNSVMTAELVFPKILKNGASLE